MNKDILQEKLELISPAGFCALTDIAAESFHSFYERVTDILSWHEARQLYDASRAGREKNKIYQARLLAHSTAPEFRLRENSTYEHTAFSGGLPSEMK